MKDRYLEVTFRKGRALAAYLYLPRSAAARSVRTEAAGRGLLVDYSAEGVPIGIEITAPSEVRLEEINEILEGLGQRVAAPEEFAPLAAA